MIFKYIYNLTKIFTSCVCNNNNNSYKIKYWDSKGTILICISKILIYKNQNKNNNIFYKLLNQTFSIYERVKEYKINISIVNPTTRNLQQTNFTTI